MNKFVLHPEAFADLTQIWDYIASDSLDAADKVIAEIREAIEIACNLSSSRSTP
jgi:plasmid stabilization system protein ParE